MAMTGSFPQGVGMPLSSSDRYASAREQYAALGIDTEKALQRLTQTPIPLHSWQGDDVGGFETAGASLSGSGLAATGHHPGKARTLDELRQDLDRPTA